MALGRLRCEPGGPGRRPRRRTRPPRPQRRSRWHRPLCPLRPWDCGGAPRAVVRPQQQRRSRRVPAMAALRPPRRARARSRGRASSEPLPGPTWRPPQSPAHPSRPAAAWPLRPRRTPAGRASRAAAPPASPGQPRAHGSPGARRGAAEAPGGPSSVRPARHFCRAPPVASQAPRARSRRAPGHGPPPRTGRRPREAEPPTPSPGPPAPARFPDARRAGAAAGRTRVPAGSAERRSLALSNCSPRLRARRSPGVAAAPDPR
mmetsp:Transcript_4756/g.13097  ORF Transcript_4756/g.13097 Transcript_4756/m.13097 type:complete len:261 (-) Transcript_4756:397-1179(-)